MGKVPFLRVLTPVVSGILFYKIISPSCSLLFVGVVGLTIMLVSFITTKQKHFSLFWVFGVGFMLYLFTLGAQYCQYRIEQTSYISSQTASSYIGEVLDLPQKKRRSVACEIQLTYPVAKKVLVYFESDTNSIHLMPGDELLLHAYIHPFKNLGNPDEFNYKEFMQNKGFSGSAYVSATSWLKTERRGTSIRAKGLRLRASVLDFYKDFDLDNDAYSFISALTLGYKADLSEDLKNAFRASGTAHILAVSGLHVGIIYVVILSTLFFLRKRGKGFVLKQLLALFCLWVYVFIVGMPISVVRAAIMLSFMSIGSIINKKGLTYNSLAATVLFILIINPLYLFDVGFQLSFASVISILFFQPKLSTLYNPKTKTANYTYTLFTLSLAAQLGVFPLVLYYFDTFPIYFFISNLLVVPFIAIIIYSVLLLAFLSILSFLNLTFLQVVYKLIALFIQLLIQTVLRVVCFFEDLPMSELKGFNISGLQVFIIFAIIVFFSVYILRKQTRHLIAFLVSIMLLLFTHTYACFKTPVNQFIIYNSYNGPEIGYRINGEKVSLQIDTNKVIAHPSATIVLLTKNRFKFKTSSYVLPVDFLVLSSDNSFSVSELSSVFQPKKIIIDTSISRYAATKMAKECDKLDIAYHDISNSGAFLINF